MQTGHIPSQPVWFEKNRRSFLCFVANRLERSIEISNAVATDEFLFPNNGF